MIACFQTTLAVHVAEWQAIAADVRVHLRWYSRLPTIRQHRSAIALQAHWFVMTSSRHSNTDIDSRFSH